MRIGLAVGYFDPQVGGSEEVVKRLAAGLSGRGHDVVVATSPHPGRDMRRMVVPVVEFAVGGNAARGMTGEVDRYQRFLLESERDVWLFYAAQIWSTDAALPLFGDIAASCVVVPCGYSGLRDPVFASYFVQLPGLLERADALVYMSKAYQDYEHDIDAGLADLARIIPNGAADDEFDNLPQREKRGGCTVLCVANHYRPKGHAAVIRAFRRAAEPHDRLVIVGEVHGRNPRGSCWLDCRIATMRDKRIKLVEHASRDEVVRWYQEADVFVFGSKVEAAPLVIIEAMAAALPFVTTPAGNVADYSDSGLVVPEAELADGLSRLLRDASQRERLGRNGRARWDRDHRWSVVVQDYERLFQEIVGAADMTPGGHDGISHEVIICTRHRPQELRRALESIAQQTLLPSSVLVIDSSEDDHSEAETRRQAQAHPSVEIRHIRSAPGLTRQRNSGVAASSAQVIHFLDDDVVCEPGYLAAIMACFSADPLGEVLGVGGLVTNVRPARPSRWKNLFGLSDADQGRVLASGRPTIVYEAAQPLEVDWLSGCCMSYRATVFSWEQFDESLLGYGLGEDVDFSYRVRQKGRLIVTPSARLQHHQSQQNRLQVEDYTYDEIVLRSRRVRSGVGELSMGAFWASVIAQGVALFVDGYALGSSESRQRLAATMRAASAARGAVAGAGKD